MKDEFKNYKQKFNEQIRQNINKKRRINICVSVDEYLICKAKNYKMNISEFVRNSLKQYLKEKEKEDNII